MQRRSNIETYPLLQSQMGIFLAWVVEPQTVAYNLPSIIPFSKNIDPERLQNALLTVIRERKELHTVFVRGDDGLPRQYADMDMHIPVVSRSMTEEELKQYTDNAFVQPFTPYAHSPLCRFEVVTTDCHTWLLVDIHHSIGDGMTIVSSLIGTDINKAYNGEPLDSHPWGMYQQAEAEQSLFSTPRYQLDKNYYSEKFAKADFASLARSADDDWGNPIVVSEYMPVGDVDKWCADRGVTPNLLFMAAFSTVMSRLCRTDDFAFFTINHGRIDRRLQRAYGMFVRSVPIMSVANENSTCEDYVRSFRREMIGSLRHTAYPFTHFCRDMGLTAEYRRSLTRGVTFGFQTRAVSEQIRINDDISYGIQLRRGKVRNDLNCMIYMDDTHYEIRIDSSDNLNDEHTLRMAAKAIMTVTGKIMAQPESRIWDIDIVDNDERDNLLRCGMGEDMPLPDNTTFIDLFLKQAALCPDKNAVVAEDGTYTYHQLERLSDNIASSMRNRGIRKGDVVAIIAERSRNFPAAAIGVMRLGAAYMPIDPQQPEKHHNRQLEFAGAKVVITPTEIKEFERHEGCGEASTFTDRDNINCCTQNDNAYIIYTSGSSGIPKGVAVSHRALLNFASFISQWWPLTSDSRITCHSPFAFDASIEDLFPPLMVGAEVHILSERLRHDIVALKEYIRLNGITGGCYTTQFGQLLIEAGAEPRDYICLGGEKLQRKPSAPCKVINTYGPTEFTVDATYHFIDNRDNDDIPIGRPLANTLAMVCDHHGRLLPWGARGELCLYGPQIANGYINDNQQTEQRFVTCSYADGKMYRTGDIVKWSEPDGTGCRNLLFIGRTDRQVKINGYRVEPEEIERCLTNHCMVNSAAVVVQCTGDKPQLSAFYTTEDDVLTPQVVRYRLSEHLPQYLIPTRIVKIDKMPLTSTGKIDRESLANAKLQTRQHDHVAPDNTIESTICDCFANTLELDKAGAEDDFFDLGGNSIDLMRLLMVLEEHGIRIAYSDAFNNTTPRAMARLVGVRQHTNTENGIKEYRIDDNYNYDAIHHLLENTPSAASPRQLGDVLLTGATGFLGVYVLRYLMLHTNSRICCCVRADSATNAMMRLRENMEYYFPDEMDCLLTDRLSVVAADIRTINPDTLPFRPSTIIHCAAHVAHFGHKDEIDNINNGGTEHIVCLCRLCDAFLVHVSTLGVGGMLPDGSMTTLTERRLWQGQIFPNPYQRSKFLAERTVLENMANGSLKAMIMRIGNIVEAAGGRRQRNASTNAFRSTVEQAMALGCYPEICRQINIDLSPVDVVAQRVVTDPCLGNGIIHNVVIGEEKPLSDIICSRYSGSSPMRCVSNDEFVSIARSHGLTPYIKAYV